MDSQIVEQTTQTAEETAEVTEVVEAQLAEVKEESVPKAKFDELHGRATRAEAELKRLKQQQNPATEKPTVSSDQFEILALSKDYSVDELRIIEKHSRAYGVSMSEAAKDEILTGGIMAKRAQAKSVSASPKAGRATSSLDEVKKLTPAQRSDKLSFDAWKQNKRISRS